TSCAPCSPATVRTAPTTPRTWCCSPPASEGDRAGDGRDGDGERRPGRRGGEGHIRPSLREVGGAGFRPPDRRPEIRRWGRGEDQAGRRDRAGAPGFVGARCVERPIQRIRR